MNQAGRPTLRARRLSQVFYGWKLVGFTVFTLAVVISPIFQGLGTFFVALERQFGWSRTALSGAFALSRAEGAILGPVEGYLTDRFGARRMVLVGLLVLGAGFIALSRIDGIVDFYVAFLVITGGAGIGGFLPLVTAINHWFVRRRATAMAIGMTGINLGGLLVPALAWSVDSLGWRPTSMGLGIGIMTLAFPLARLVRNRPEEYGLRPDGDPPLPAAGEGVTAIGDDGDDEDSFTLGEAIRTPAFWAITAAHGFSAVAAVTVSVHIIPALTDMDMSLTAAATVVTAFTMTGVIFQVLGGLIGDRVSKPPAIAAFVSIQGLGMVVAATIRTVPGAYLFAVLYGIGFGGRVPLLTAIRGDYFGRKNFATIFGVSQLPMNVAMMGAPLAAGFLFDNLGSYMIPFLGVAAMNGMGAVFILLARKPASPSAHRARAGAPERPPTQGG